MNLADLYGEANNLQNDILKFEHIIKSIKEVNKLSKSYIVATMNTLVLKDIVGNTTECINNARNITNISKTYFNNFINKIRQIDLPAFTFDLASIKGKYKRFDINESVDKILNNIGSIHKFTACINNTELLNNFLECYNALEEILNECNNIASKIEQTKNIYNILIGEKDNEQLKIRLMTEENQVELLIENLSLIQSVYNSVNKLIGDKDIDLQYSRAESGTFEIYLVGCATTLVTLVPVFKLLYKIYSENFSWKAKQDKQLGEIKVRREILALIKDKRELNSEDQQLIQNCLADIELNGRKLFINNPTIKLNDEQIGLNEENLKNIDKKYLEWKLLMIKPIQDETKLDEEKNE